MFTRLIDYLTRSPRKGDGKDLPMPADPNAPAVTVPAPSGFDQQLLALADAVRELSRSHQTLLDVATRAAARPAPPTPMPRPDPTIAGDPGDGLRPSAVVDYTRLSPVQQIALGLRTTVPQGQRAVPTRPPVPRAASPVEPYETAHAGAD